MLSSPSSSPTPRPWRFASASRRGVAAALALLACASGAAAAPADYPETPQVVGGTTVSPGQFPFLIYLLRDGFFCTGSLIRDDWVLTAAHCGEPTEIDITDALPGAAGPGHLVYFMEPAEWIPHPDYSGPPEFRNDIALIRLPLDASDFPPELDGDPLYIPEPLNLASAPASTAASIGDVIVAGFGRTDAGTPPDIANWAEDIPTIPAGQCDFSITASKQLCFGTYPNTCQGDSGSAIFKQQGTAFVQYGVFSYNGGADMCGLINSVATYVPAYVDWINDQIDPPASDPITLGWELPPASSNGAASGISNVQGYAFSSEGAIESIELFVDGVSAASLPCCSERGDVKSVFPVAPLLSGFSAARNYGLDSPGNHQMRLVVRDSAGNEKQETRTVRTVRILPGVTFARDLSTAGASCYLVGDDGIECTGLTFANGSCGGKITFKWSNGKQVLEVSQGCH